VPRSVQGQGDLLDGPGGGGGHNTDILATQLAVTCIGILAILILLILIKLSLSSLEREISSLIFRLEVDEDDTEDNSACKVIDMNDVEEKLIVNNVEKCPV